MYVCTTGGKEAQGENGCKSCTAPSGWDVHYFFFFFSFFVIYLNSFFSLLLLFFLVGGGVG